MKNIFHHHFNTFDMKIDSVIAICNNNFKYEENQPKRGDLISFREMGDYYQTFIVEEHHKINDESYKLIMKKINCRTYTEQWGKPQGNELVYGKDIIRRTDTLEFSVIDRFKSSEAANQAYQDWMEENK